MTKTTDLVYAGASLRERQDYALALSKAGELIPRGLRDANGQPNAGKILLVTEYGNALGIHPIIAINGIDIIEGNLTITPALMSGLIREAGHKLRISTKGTGTQLAATAVLIRADDPAHPFEVTWTMADAKAAGLDAKSNWKKYPRAMLKARAISEVAREGAEDVLMGAHYTAEEMGATVNEAGEVIEDAEVVEQDHDGPNVTATMRANPPVRDVLAWWSLIQEQSTVEGLATVWEQVRAAHALNLQFEGRPLGDIMRDLKERLVEVEIAAQERAEAERAQQAVEDIELEDVPF